MYLDLDVVEVNVYESVNDVFVVVIVIDYVDDVSIDDDDVENVIVIWIVYVDDVSLKMIAHDHVVFDDVICLHDFPRRKIFSYKRSFFVFR